MQPAYIGCGTAFTKKMKTISVFTSLRLHLLSKRLEKAFFYVINVKIFHGSLTTVVRAQTANITDTIFDIIFDYKRRRFENRSDQTFCILLIKDVLSLIVTANLCLRQNLK